MKFERAERKLLDLLDEALLLVEIKEPLLIFETLRQLTGREELRLHLIPWHRRQPASGMA
jgi:hypothetical protein